MPYIRFLGVKNMHIIYRGASDEKSIYRGALTQKGLRTPVIGHSRGGQFVVPQIQNPLISPIEK